MVKPPGKPPFSIVAGETAIISSPRPLGSHGQRLWDRIQREYRIDDCGGTELLYQACAATDRVEALAEAIARDGEVVHSRSGVPRSHPSIRDELQLRAFIVKTIEKLGINFEAIKPLGRPSGWSPGVG